MGYSINRTTVANTTVRFFMERHQAIGQANALTRATNEQYKAVRAYLNDSDSSHVGYPIENAVRKTFQDTDGVLPEVVVQALRIRR